MNVIYDVYFFFSVCLCVLGQFIETSIFFDSIFSGKKVNLGVGPVGGPNGKFPIISILWDRYL